MATFTELFDMIDVDLLMQWTCYPMRKKHARMWPQAVERFHVTLAFEGKQTLVNYFGPLQDPCSRDVIACLLLDALAVHDKTFSQFCDNYGYSVNSHESKRLFKLCKKNRRKLQILLGNNMFTQFMNCEMDW